MVFQIDVDECSEMLHNCDQTCVNTNGSFICQCGGGYRLFSDKHTCAGWHCCQHMLTVYSISMDGCICFVYVDINECVENPGLCNITGQGCTNLAGSYNCSCPLGTEVIEGACRCAFLYITLSISRRGLSFLF